MLIPRGRLFLLAGFALSRSRPPESGAHSSVTTTFASLHGTDRACARRDGAAAAILGAVLLVRYPAAVPVVLLAAAPFRIPVRLGQEDAFLLLPLYLVVAAAALALAYRVVRGSVLQRRRSCSRCRSRRSSPFSAASFLWTWDERAGGIAAFFVFPFVAGFAIVARSPLAAWLPRALLVTLVVLGSLFAAIGIWQAQTRTVFFARDVEVANAYTSFFRVTSLFKDPSLYGRYLVVPIAVLLVVVLIRRGRTVDWVVASAFVAFLFWGLFYSYSQSSFVALFAVTFESRSWARASGCESR